MLGFCFVFTSDGGNGRRICMRIYTRMDGMKVWVIAKLKYVIRNCICIRVYIGVCGMKVCVCTEAGAV